MALILTEEQEQEGVMEEIRRKGSGGFQGGILRISCAPQSVNLLVQMSRVYWAFWAILTFHKIELKTQQLLVELTTTQLNYWYFGKK